jgi:hypothetical protein
MGLFYLMQHYLLLFGHLYESKQKEILMMQMQN